MLRTCFVLHSNLEFQFLRKSRLHEELSRPAPRPWKREKNVQLKFVEYSDRFALRTYVTVGWMPDNGELTLVLESCKTVWEVNWGINWVLTRTMAAVNETIADISSVSPSAFAPTKFTLCGTYPYPITSMTPEMMTYISRAGSPFLQTMSPGVKMRSFILSTRSCRNSGWHFCRNVTWSEARGRVSSMT